MLNQIAESTDHIIHNIAYVFRPYIFALYRLTRARQKPGQMTDSAGGPGVPEVIYNPAAIYGMTMFWVSFNLGVASDIQYTRDNHT